MAGMNGGDPVKVVIINTQYVETDAGSFKSVVQRLTGKDATTVAEDRPASTQQKKNIVKGPELGREMSFKELPSLDELLRLFPDY